MFAAGGEGVTGAGAVAGGATTGGAVVAQPPSVAVAVDVTEAGLGIGAGAGTAGSVCQPPSVRDGDGSAARVTTGTCKLVSANSMKDERRTLMRPDYRRLARSDRALVTDAPARRVSHLVQARLVTITDPIGSRDKVQSRRRRSTGRRRQPPFSTLHDGPC